VAPGIHPETPINPFKMLGGKAFNAVGFYKRGCQEKTPFLFREEGIFF
jgi:hypothetical protein